jgi:hypothetical protein
VFSQGRRDGEAKLNTYPEDDSYGDGHDTMITQPCDLQDHATPSGHAVAATVLLKLAGLAVKPRYAELARESLVRVEAPAGGGMMAQYPLGFGQWPLELAYALSSPREVSLVGKPFYSIPPPDASVYCERQQRGQQVVPTGPFFWSKMVSIYSAAPCIPQHVQRLTTLFPLAILCSIVAQATRVLPPG